MSINNNLAGKRNIEHKILFKNTYYSYLTHYGTYIFSMINSFIVARLISMDLWGFFILAISYITIINSILTFLPPGLAPSLKYHIAIYKNQDQKNKIKSLIKYSLFQKLLFTIPIFLLSLLIFQIFRDLFRINLQDYLYLLFILSPLIIHGGISSIFQEINKGLDMFKTLFYLLVLKYMINIGALIVTFLIINQNRLEIIVFIHLFSVLIPSILNGIIMLGKYIGFKSTSEDDIELTFKESISQTLNYGSYLTFGNIITNIWEQVKVQAIGIYEGSDWVTGYHISNDYIVVPRKGISSLEDPMTVSFSRLHSQENHSRMNKMFDLIFYYSSFLFMLSIGIFFFISDFFLSFIYSPSYLMFSILIKLMLIFSVFKILGPQVHVLIKAKNRTKFDPKYKIIVTTIAIPLFFIGLLYYGLYGAIFGLLIGDFIAFLFRIVICIKYFDTPINLKKILFQFLTFFLSLIFVIIINELFLDNLNYQLLKTLNLLFFEEINFLAVLIFIMMLFILTFSFKIFSYEDLESIEKLFEGKNRLKKIINKFLKLLKKIIRKKKVD